MPPLVICMPLFGHVYAPFGHLYAPPMQSIDGAYAEISQLCIAYTTNEVNEQLYKWLNLQVKFGIKEWPLNYSLQSVYNWPGEQIKTLS